MCRTRLILLDGIAGSGKSTTGQRLFRALNLAEVQAEFHHEFARPHPVLDINESTIGGWVEQSHHKWTAFADRMRGGGIVTILDGALFQCGIGELLERDARDGEILDFVDRLQPIVEPLEPLLIHLYQDDVETALREVYNQRTKAWRHRVGTVFQSTTYGRNRTLEGFDLYLDFVRNLRRLSDLACDSWGLEKTAIRTGDDRWDERMERILRLLDVHPANDPFRPDDYAGEYVVDTTGQRCVIREAGGYLQVEGLFEIVKRLLPGMGDTLFVETWPDILAFGRDDVGCVVEFQAAGSSRRIGDSVWKRVSPPARSSSE